MSYTKHMHTHKRCLCLPCVPLAGSLSTWITGVWKHNTDKSWQLYTWFQAAAFKCKCKETASSTAAVCRQHTACFHLATDLPNTASAYPPIQTLCVWCLCYVNFRNHGIAKGCEGMMGRENRQKREITKAAMLNRLLNIYNNVRILH